MIIKKLEVKGEGKEPGVIDFEEGLNVIAGASDTGKSYITQCFQFIFGSEKPPKEVEQAKGYTHLEVTFELSNEHQFLLSRELKDKSDVTMKELKADGLTTILKPNHKGKSNLSKFFLGQFGLDDKTLVFGFKSMKPSALTLRIFEKIFLVDEKRIISEESPLGTGQNNEETLEKSLLKTLLTGEDDSEILERKESKQSKEKLKTKIEGLQEFLSRFFPQEEDVKNSLDELDVILNDLEESFERAEKELNDLIEANNGLVNQRSNAQEQANQLGNIISDDKTLFERFELLETKYLSDRERLEANSEAVTYMESHRLVNCPLCGSEVEEQEDLDVRGIIQANRSEIAKIDAHLEDLRSTQSNLRATLEENEAKQNSLLGEVARLDEFLGQSIRGKLNENRALLRQLDSTRTKFRKERDQEKKRQEIFKEIGQLQVKFDEILDSYQFPDFSFQVNQLGTEISKILQRWDFPNGGRTVFDIESRDAIIGGKPRSHYGKGYRAICFSAILLGLMEYLYPKGRHPGFVILDSPLTTYKKRDESAEIDNEEVVLANNLIYAFYRDLCDFYKEKQIIVLDNQEPDEDLHPSMHYIHFSGNNDVGRYGFFPVSKLGQ